MTNLQHLAMLHGLRLLRLFLLTTVRLLLYRLTNRQALHLNLCPVFTHPQAVLLLSRSISFEPVHHLVSSEQPAGLVLLL